MKKTLLTLCLMAFTMYGWAAKAYTFPVTVKQSDGTFLTVITYGDEHYHWHTTLDGTLLYREGRDFFIADVDAYGNLIKTKQLAHNANERSSSELSLIKSQNKRSFFNAVSARHLNSEMHKEPVQANADSFFPHVGEPTALVILVDFPDVNFSLPDPRKSFEQYLNGVGKPEEYGNRESRNYSSVAQYFRDASYGMFKPKFDIAGPVRLNKNSSYYGKNNGGRSDINYRELLHDACNAVDNEIDFKKYDANGDGYVDLVYVIYAGYSESMGGDADADWIWPKSWVDQHATNDGVTVGRCGINNELNGYPGAFSEEPKVRINGIGLFCHEFSHCIGLPDFYPTTPEAQLNNQGMEFWSLMDGGEYLDNGYTPPSYTAWEREAFGWMNIETLQETQQDLTLIPIDREGGKAYRIMNDNDATGREYFMIENIQNESWNSKQKGHGLLVYHVNYNSNTFSIYPNGSNSVNNVIGKPGMAVVPADNMLFASYNVKGQTENGVVIDKKYYYAQLAGDTYPGTSNVLSLADTSGIVNFKVYSGDKLNKAFVYIRENTADKTITLNFYKDFASGINNMVSEDQYDNRIYSIDGRFAGTSKENLKKGVYIINRKKIVVKQ